MSRFTIDIADYARVLKGVLLDEKSKQMEYAEENGRPGRTGKAVLVSVDLTTEDFRRRDSHGTRFGDRKLLSFLMVGHSYTFVALTDFATPAKPEDFVNVSNHSSCWKDAMRDEVRRIERKMIEELVPDYPDGADEAVIDAVMDARRALYVSASEIGVGAGVSVVEVRLESDPSSRHSNGYRITSMNGYDKKQIWY